MKRKAIAKPKQKVNADGFSSAISGIGDLSRDKRQGHSPYAASVSVAEADMLWLGDDIGARIVEEIPDQCFRQGYTIACGGDLGATVDAVTRLEELDIDSLCIEAMCYQRAFGGGAVVLGVDDGNDPSQPVDLERVRGVNWATAVEGADLVPVFWYSDPNKPKYGKPSIYQLQATSPGMSEDGKFFSGVSKIHESRIVAFEGVRTRRRSMVRLTTPGWGNSVFVRVYEAIRDFSNAFAGAGILALDFSQPIYKMDGLAELMSSEGGESVVKARLQVMEFTRSILRAMFIDSKDHFERQTTNVSGMPDLMDRLCNRLAAATGIPVTILMGQAPAGLNATGDADLRNYYDRIRNMQTRVVAKKLERVISLIFAGMGAEPDNWSVSFNPLWQLTEKEQAEVRNIQAQTDAIYISNGVLGANEVAISRFGGDKYSTDTVIDLKNRPVGGEAMDPVDEGRPEDDQADEGKHGGESPSEVGSEEGSASL